MACTTISFLRSSTCSLYHDSLQLPSSCFCSPRHTSACIHCPTIMHSFLSSSPPLPYFLFLPSFSVALGEISQSTERTRCDASISLSTHARLFLLFSNQLHILVHPEWKKHPMHRRSTKLLQLSITRTLVNVCLAHS